jgi:hypothetical protein
MHPANRRAGHHLGPREPTLRQPLRDQRVDRVVGKRRGSGHLAVVGLYGAVAQLAEFAILVQLRECAHRTPPLRHQLRDGLNNHGQPMREVRARRIQGMHQRVEGDFGMRLDVIRKKQQVGAQRLGRSRRDTDREATQPEPCLGGRDRRPGNHHVRCGAGEVEGMHARMNVRHQLPSRKVASLAGQVQRRVLQTQMRIGHRNVQRRGNDAVMHQQHGLDEAGDAGCRLGVADIGLHRTHGARVAGKLQALFGGQGLQAALENVELKRVTHLRAGAMRFDVHQVRSPHPALAQHTRDELGVLLAVGLLVEVRPAAVARA